MRHDQSAERRDATASPEENGELLVIVNPTAGGAGGAGLRAALGELSTGNRPIRIAETRGRGDAERFARAAAADSSIAGVVAAGGDGTINEVVNGLADASEDRRPKPLGLLPLGTANVLAGELGLEDGPLAAAKVILAGATSAIHLGTCNDRLFAMMAGIGFDARVVAGVDPALKRRVGKAAYVYQSLVEIARHRATTYTVRVDGADYRAGSAIIANGHFYAGRYIVAPDARLDRAGFEVALFEQGRRVDALRYSTRMVLGRLSGAGDVRVVGTARVIEVDGPIGEPVQADGDIIATLPVTIRPAARTLAVFAPYHRVNEA